MKKKIVSSFINPQKGFTTPSIILYSCWKTSGITPLRCWGYPPSNKGHKCKPAHPCAPGRQIILPKCTEGTILDNCTTKRVKIAKLSLFNNPPMELIPTINDWITSLKYYDKHMDILKQIKIHQPPFFANSCTRT